MKKLWLLERTYDDIFSYDENYGFVICANTEKQARKIASLESGDENDSKTITSPWLRPEKSSCRQLIAENEKIGLILRDFNAG